MNPAVKAAADRQLAVYAKLSKAFLQARADDARIQAKAIHEHAAYWTYIAERCDALANSEPIRAWGRGKS